MNQRTIPVTKTTIKLKGSKRKPKSTLKLLICIQSNNEFELVSWQQLSKEISVTQTKQQP
jgi:hypothetical protein